jgi:hypothetical protein
MGTRSIFLGQLEVTNVKSCPGLSDCPGDETVPETDTGGLVENTEALERTMPKELGKLLA